MEIATHPCPYDIESLKSLSELDFSYRYTLKIYRFLTMRASSIVSGKIFSTNKTLTILVDLYYSSTFWTEVLYSQGRYFLQKKNRGPHWHISSLLRNSISLLFSIYYHFALFQKNSTMFIKNHTTINSCSNRKSTVLCFIFNTFIHIFNCSVFLFSLNILNNDEN